MTTKEIKNIWVIVPPSGKIDIWTISFYRRDTIKNFVRSMHPEKYDWEYFKSIGYTCKKADATFYFHN